MLLRFLSITSRAHRVEESCIQQEEKDVDDYSFSLLLISLTLQKWKGKDFFPRYVSKNSYANQYRCLIIERRTAAYIILEGVPFTSVQSFLSSAAGLGCTFSFWKKYIEI